MAWVRDKRRTASEERARLRSSVLLSVAALTLLVSIGTVVMRYTEDWSWISSFYFSVTTLATVGYGDLHPTHEVSRLFVAFYVITGVTTALSAMTIVGRNYLEFIEHRLMRDRWRMRHGRSAHHRRSSDDDERRDPFHR
ncbi:MAG: two pore domain potassium channel family protein [Flavobacteriales bacterium]|nr:MAG: two pore domain potassium channel family protein [Flavobacteriales bacterium]